MPGLWRVSPFTKGHRYRVLKDFKVFRDNFNAGEVMTYSDDSWSRYDGIIGYFFVDGESGRVRALDVDDDDSLTFLEELLEELYLDENGVEVARPFKV